MKAIKKITWCVATVAAITIAVVLAGDASVGAAVTVQQSAAEAPGSVVTAPSRAPAEAAVNTQPSGAVSSSASAPAATPTAATKPVTTTKKAGSTAPKATTTKSAATAPVSKKPIGGVVVIPNMGTDDPSKVGMYCMVIGGKYFGKLCPKPEGSPV
jgi:uncharacterized membrane protein